MAITKHLQISLELGDDDVTTSIQTSNITNLVLNVKCKSINK